MDKMMEEEKSYLYWLCRLPALGAVSIKKMGEYFGSFACVYNIEESKLRRSGILTSQQIQKLLRWKGQYFKCVEEFENLKERGIRFLTPMDEDYPEKLLQIPDYPMGLYVRGKLPVQNMPVVAIVGARGCSAYGAQLAEEFARALAGEGVQIVSGLALGIDGAAHNGALRAETSASTFGILGCGVNICYPPSHYKLYEKMIKRGGILSEFAPDTAPLRQNFPMRNRIISGLSDVVLVVEARKKSGSLITAEFGLEQGREIFAIPGRITDYLSGGCNRLIQQGANMAMSPNDILEYLDVRCKKELIIHENNVNGLAKKEKMVYSCLDFKPKHLETILSETGFPLSECMSILIELELQGFVFRSGNHYARQFKQ